jgi:hypothetical protein
LPTKVALEADAAAVGRLAFSGSASDPIGRRRQTLT